MVCMYVCLLCMFDYLYIGVHIGIRAYVCVCPCTWVLHAHVVCAHVEV